MSRISCAAEGADEWYDPFFDVDSLSYSTTSCAQRRTFHILSFTSCSAVSKSHQRNSWCSGLPSSGFTGSEIASVSVLAT